MHQCIFALPALLRGALFLAASSHAAFHVHDDILAFPQYEVDFSEDYVSESLAHARLVNSRHPNDDTASHLEQYRSSDFPSSNGDEELGTGTGEMTYDYESMTLDGQRYLCSIPQIDAVKEAKALNDTVTPAEAEKELARAKDRGWELLSGMEGNCVYFISGWWSYKFCYNEGIRQFHQLPPSKGVPPFPPVEDPGVAGYTLGKYIPPDDGKDDDGGDGGDVASDVGKSRKSKDAANYGKLVRKGDSTYLSQTLYGGTTCDLTGRGRKTEVQFHCNPHFADRVSLIKETSTCEYLMIIHTPRLCNDVAFQPPQRDHPHAITCSPILAEDELEEYQELLSSLHKAAEQTAEGTLPNVFAGAGRKIVGDVEIGGHHIVPVDLKLEKSAIVGGGKETYVDTIASSDGRSLGKEEIERLGLGDMKSVEELKKRLEAMAQGQDWKLDVIDTPRGREYRGVIGSDDEEGEKKTLEQVKKEKGKEKEREREGSKEEYYVKEEL